MITLPQIEQTVTKIRHRIGEFAPMLGFTCGSGTSSLADDIVDPIVFSYDELPGFEECSVEGHESQLTLGTLQGCPVACLQGRAHFYEQTNPIAMQLPIRVLKALGCDTLVLTNAAGGINPRYQLGDIVLIGDHINLSCHNPLVGANDDHVGPRFPDMTHAYDPALRQQMRDIAVSYDLTLEDGVYIGVLGPSYETPAEIKAYALLGADLVGMSTVSDVIIARHCGLRVLALSIVTNMAAGLNPEPLTHERALSVALGASKQLKQLIMAFAERVAHPTNQTKTSA